jgi:hypothetical protein
MFGLQFFGCYPTSKFESHKPHFYQAVLSLGATCKRLQEISQSGLILQRFWIFSDKGLPTLANGETQEALDEHGRQIIPLKMIFESLKSPSQSAGNY